MRKNWPVITSIIITIYGAFLLFQAFFPEWRMVQEGGALNIAKIIGGIVLIAWSIVFFITKEQVK